MKLRIVLAASILMLGFSLSWAQIDNFREARNDIMMAALDREEAMYEAFRSVQRSAALEKTFALDIEQERPPVSWASYLHPYFLWDISYDSNIYNLESATDDFVSIATPGVQFRLGAVEPNILRWTKKPHFSVDAGVNLIYYHRVSFKHQNPYARVSYQLGEQKGTNKALFDYKFQKNTATTSSIDTGIGGFVDSRSENLDVNYELDLNRVGLSLGYSGDFTLYEGDYKSTNTYRDQYGSIGGFFRFPSMPRTRFFIEYDHGKNTYYKSATTSDDCRYNKYWVGIEDRITPRIFGVAKFGYQDRDYKGSKDRTSTITKVRLEYRYSSLTKFLLNVYTGGIDSPYRSDGYTVQDLVGLEFYHRFSSNRKLSCMTGLEYQVNTYVTPKKENTTRFRLGLDYAFRKWFNLGFKYKYEKKDSNIDHLDYKTGVYTLEAKAVF